MKANEMAALGDVHVGTEFPLRMRFVADPSKPRDIRDDGQVEFTIGDVQIYSGDRLVRDRTEQRIAMYLMFYGGWEYEMVADVDGKILLGVDHRWTPQEDHHQGFEIVSSLSSMYSLMFRHISGIEDVAEEGDLFGYSVAAVNLGTVSLFVHAAIERTAVVDGANSAAHRSPLLDEVAESEASLCRQRASPLPSRLQQRLDVGLETGDRGHHSARSRVARQRVRGGAPGSRRTP